VPSSPDKTINLALVRQLPSSVVHLLLLMMLLLHLLL
jgi:hypothetical protein